MAVKAVQILPPQRRAGLVQRRGGNAGGQHEPHVHRQALRGLKHIRNTVGPHDVGNLMGVHDDSGRAMGQHGPGELAGGDHGALQVDVGVNKSGQDDPAGHVHLRLPAVLAHTHNQSLRHGDVAVANLAAEHIDVGGVLQHQIGPLPARRHLHNPQLLVQLPVDPAGVALGSHGIPSSLSAARAAVI